MHAADVRGLPLSRFSAMATRMLFGIQAAFQAWYLGALCFLVIFREPMKVGHPMVLLAISGLNQGRY